MSDDTVNLDIPLDLLMPSPFNEHRKLEAIPELAANIKAEGRVLQRLLVRPSPCSDRYEIVFGHRRHAALDLLGWPSAPCEVRAMTEAEARSAQASENVQRENLDALAEAHAYRQMMEADGLSADQVAERIGKSRAHVYARVRLLQACEPVRHALAAGELRSEAALLVARLRTEKLQLDALRFLKARGCRLEDGGELSFRQIRGLLNDRYSLELSEAIFDREAPDLVPEAGPCGSCPKRAGNAPEFADVVDAGVKGAAVAPVVKGVDHAARERQRQAAQRTKDEAALLETGRRAALLARIREAAGASERTTLELRLIARAAVRGVDYRESHYLLQPYSVKSIAALITRIDAMAAHEVALLLLDCALVAEVPVSAYGPAEKPSALLALAQQYGIDAKAIAAEASGAAKDVRSGELFESGDQADAETDDAEA